LKRAAALLLALTVADWGSAATAYVTDELVLGVYAQPSTQGARLATLHSGAVVETLSTEADATQVRLTDGTTGWVKTAYLTTASPATVRIKQLQDELDRSRATTPMLAEAAERNEVERLTRELASRPGKLDGSVPLAVPGFAPAFWLWLAAVTIAFAGGFWLGYTILARRIKAQFGGIKVY